MEIKKKVLSTVLKRKYLWERMNQNLCPSLYDFVLYFTDQGTDSRKLMVGQTWDKGLNVLEVSFRSQFKSLVAPSHLFGPQILKIDKKNERQYQKWNVTKQSTIILY